MQPDSSTPLTVGSAKLRPWRRSDRDSLVKHGDNRRVWLHLRDRFPHPYTTADAQEWLTFVGGLTEPTHFAIEIDGEAVGGIGFEVQPDVFGRTAEIGYWLGEAYWGRGVMTEAVRVVSRHAFERFDYTRLFAGVFESNPASARVLEKAGYTLEGRMRAAVFKDGRVLDNLIYARLRDDP